LIHAWRNAEEAYVNSTETACVEPARLPIAMKGSAAAPVFKSFHSSFQWPAGLIVEICQHC